MKLLIVLLWLVAFPALAGTVYKTIDADGKTVYTDRMPEKGTKLTQTFTYEDLPSTPIPESVLRRQAELEKSIKTRLANQAANSGPQPTLFSAAWCGYCTQAKAYLAQKGIQYREYDIDTKEGMQAMASAGLGKGIPVLMRDGKTQRGFSRQGYDAFFAN
ncbi:glutaredoxin domain-containing protein [soil metagenome]